MVRHVWIVYDEDPEQWHAYKEPTGLACERKYNRGVEGPLPEVPKTLKICPDCRTVIIETAMGVVEKVKRSRECSDEELEAMDAPALRAAYKNLREHHIKETTMLLQRSRGVCGHRWSAWSPIEGGGYSRHCTLVGCESQEFARHLVPLLPSKS